MQTLICNTVKLLEPPAKLAEDLERCDREIAAARKALLTGSLMHCFGTPTGVGSAISFKQSIFAECVGYASFRVGIA